MELESGIARNILMCFEVVVNDTRHAMTFIFTVESYVWKLPVSLFHASFPDRLFENVLCYSCIE